MLRKRPFFWPFIVLTALVALLSLSPGLVLAGGAQLPLETLEARLADAPDVSADESTVQAKLQALRATQDKAGLSYLYNNTFGPAAIIVPRSYDDHVLRYAQTVGVSLPLLGTNIEQQLAILSAAEQEQIAVIDLNRIRREKLAALRTAYTEYWGYDDQSNVALGYVTGSQWDLSMGKSLRKAGFYTPTNLLDIVSSIQKVQFDITSFGNLQQAQLAAIDSAVGYEVPAFQPVEPTFYDGCKPDRVLALQSALDVDPALAQLQAETIQVQHELAQVKGSSIQASADLQGGSTTDINHQVSGYDLNAGLNVALPVRSRDEERALRAQYTAELQALAFNEKQQRITIESTLDATLQNLSSAQTILAQSLSDADARQTDLRTATAAFTLMRQTPAGISIDVHAKRNDLYAAQVQVSLARENILLQATNLLLVAPAACGAGFTPIPPFTPPTHPPHKHHTKKGQPAPSPTPGA